MKKFLTSLFFSFLFFSATSQQAIMFGQYFVNDVIYNPAISGSKEYNQLTIQTRKQWLGFEGAPLSANISYHGALNNRSALGGFLEYDQTYPSSQSNLQMNYAYHVPLNKEDIYLSFGVGAKFMYYNLDFNLEDLPPGNDPAFSAKSYENFLGDASSGVYLYGNNFYIGYSVLNMIESSFNKEAGYGFSNNIEERIYYGLAGYKIRIDRDWHIEPSILLRNLDDRDLEYNFSTRVFYSDQIWSGLSIRSNSSLSFFVGTNKEKTQIAYSFDYYFGEIQNYQSGTHEFTISFRVPNFNK
jgi:type IX secretion system PorP/SprF family membrane protein